MTKLKGKNKDKSKQVGEAIHHEGHQLKTRRDFLSQGFLGTCALTMMPNVLDLIVNGSAFAQDCAPAVFDGKTPVLIFDLAGGANIAGSNVMVGGAGGQMDFLQSYRSLGLPADMHPSLAGQLNNSLGLAFHGDSSMLRGINSRINATVRAKVDGAVFCTSSGDDTGNNPHNPIYWLNKAGAKGQLTQLAGTRNSDSGGRSMVPMASMNPTLKPVQINRPEDALGLVNIGTLGNVFDENKVQRVLKAIERMSERKLMSFQEQSLPMQIKELVKCGYVNSQDLIGRFTPEAIDPRLDNDVNNAFDNLGNGDQRKVATMAKLLLDGHLGVATVEKGGYDYHDKTRATGERRDFDAGELIGRVLQLAAAKNKNIMIYVITDGGVAARDEIDNSADGRGKYVWSGDSGQRSSSFMLVYRDAGKIQLRTTNRQIGHFKESGGVENAATPSSNSVTNLAKLVTANYLALHEEEGMLNDVVGDNPFTNLEQYLIFQKI
tara:strand:- start:411155 stop:412627 length:1473 start_codon:yes stop_codon:yes gene_type:complete